MQTRRQFFQHARAEIEIEKLTQQNVSVGKKEKKVCEETKRSARVENRTKRLLKRKLKKSTIKMSKTSLNINGFFDKI